MLNKNKFMEMFYVS